MAMSLSIIIPAVNEAENLGTLLHELTNGSPHNVEIIVVDGGSSDNTRQIASQYTDKIITSVRGRAKQMNAGAFVASGNIFWFLHADSQLSNDLLSDMMLQSKHKKVWGFFKIRLSGRNVIFRIIEFMMNRRSCITGIATGDQGIFISKDLFLALGGFAEIPLMEDIAITKQLKKKQRPLCMKQHQLTTSSRRWEERGILRTVLLMWRLRLAYFLGADPEQLVKQYY